MNRLLIIGASGHGKVIADIALKCGYQNIAFIDDKAVGECMNFPIIGTSDDLNQANDGNTDFIIGIGNNQIRKMFAETYWLNWITLIHPSAQIGLDVKIGIGTVVMANSVINSGTSIGKHGIINSAAVVEHDNKLGDYVHISPNAALAGTVHVGDNTHIGIGATVKNNINICSDCIIGTGSVIVKNIVVSGTYVGVPAQKLIS